MEKARQQIEQIANQMPRVLRRPPPLSRCRRSLRTIKAKDQKSFVLGSPLGEGPSASTSEALEDAIYGMKEGEVTKTPIKVGESYYIVGVKKRQEANMDDFAKQRDDLMEQMLSRRNAAMYFSDYLAATRQRLEADGDIKVYKDAIAKLDAQDERDAPAGGAGDKQ